MATLNLFARYLKPPLFLGLIAFGCLSIETSLYSQTPGNAATEDRLQKATNAFNTGDYATAASILADFTSKAQDTSKLEPLFYMLGASYFNIPNYADAVTAFQKYLATYKNGEHADDVTLALARSLVNLKRPEEALPLLKSMETKPAYRERVLFLEANIGMDSGDTASAISALEKIVLPSIRSTTSANAAVTLATLYLKNGDIQKASDLLNQLQKDTAKVTNIFDLNKLAINLGDTYRRQNQNEKALDAWRTVLTKDQVITAVEQRIVQSQKALETNLDAIRKDPKLSTQVVTLNNEIKTSIEQDKASLEKYKAAPDFTGFIWIRMAEAYSALGRKWEALVVFNELLGRAITPALSERALKGKIITLADLNQRAEAIACCAEFIKTYPQSDQLPLVMYLQGAYAFQAKDYANAEAILTKSIPEQKNRVYLDNMEFILAAAQFSGGKYDAAVASCQKYEKAFPQGTNIEEAYYITALATLLNGYPVKAYSCFQDYLTKFPEGKRAPDCAYRSAYCKFADQKYDEVLRLCDKWFTDYPANPDQGQVFALIGDADIALQKSEEALDAYMKAVANPSSDQNLSYSLRAAGKLLEKKGDWATLSNMWETYVKDHPDQPLVLEAMLAISKSKTHEGKIDEAKKFLVDTIKTSASDPSKEGVEPLLVQLMKLCAKSRAISLSQAAMDAPPASTTPNIDGAPPAPPPPPSNPFQDPKEFAEVDSLLDPLKVMPSATAHARYLYARGEYSRFRRNFVEQQSCLKQIAEGFKPVELSATLLGLAGDYCLKQKQWKEAQAFYMELVVGYPRSEVADFGYVGLGQIELGRKDYAAALNNFNNAMDKVTGDTKIKDALAGKAQALVGLNQLDEAQQIFAQVIKNRAWHGETTALCEFSLGEIKEKQSKWDEAHIYYQHVYVAYQRYVDYVAKAYIKSAECLTKLGKTQDAINTYREMLQNPRLAGMPEIQQAKDGLKHLGAAG